jgi:hypothetical protein
VNPLSSNLFTLLTLIVAPAVLTNASSVLGLNTANRFGRIVDRSRELVEEMERAHGDAELNTIRLRQVGRLRRRAAFLLRAQTCFYAALGLFVVGALVSVVGAVLGTSSYPLGYHVAGIAGFTIGATAGGSLFYGCTLLIRETRLALLSLSEETELLEARIRSTAAQPAEPRSLL